MTPELNNLRKLHSWHHKCFAALISSYLFLFSLDDSWTDFWFDASSIQRGESFPTSLAIDLWTSGSLVTVTVSPSKWAVCWLPWTHQHKLLCWCCTQTGILCHAMTSLTRCEMLRRTIDTALPRHSKQVLHPHHVSSKMKGPQCSVGLNCPTFWNYAFIYFLRTGGNELKSNTTSNRSEVFGPGLFL